MQNLYKTTAVVTVFSTFEHALGFLYRIILSRTLGSEGLGVYQASLSVFALFLTLTCSGLPITLSRFMTKHYTARQPRRAQASTTAAICITLFISLPVTLFLFLFRGQVSLLFSDERQANLFYILLLSLSFNSVYAVLRGNFWGEKRFFIYSLIELIEEMIMICAGVFLLLSAQSAEEKINLAAVAVILSYFCSFCIATAYFLWKGGKLRSPKGELKPLLKSAIPVTAMRTSSSLVNSLVSVLFPMRLIAFGASAQTAFSEYGVIYGMVMPILTIPSTLISSIALVLVPNLSECFYQKQREKLSLLVEKALNSTLLIVAILIPVLTVLGKDIGVLLFSNYQSGTLISLCSVMLLPMSLTMICTSILNSLQCEKYTLLFFLLGAGFMLLCAWFLPPYLGSGALLLGMGGDFLLTSVCSLILLYKKTGSLRSARYFFRAVCAVCPVIVLSFFLRSLCFTYFGFLPALLLTACALTLLEIFFFLLFRIVDKREIMERFCKKKAKKR